MLTNGKSCLIPLLKNAFESYIHIAMDMHNYDNTPMQYSANFNYCENVHFQLKMFNVCLIFA